MPPCFPSIFAKGDNFPDFLFAFVDSIVLPKCSQLLMVRISPSGANSFLPELTSIQKGDKNKNGRVASPESVPIHLNFFSCKTTLKIYHFWT